MSGVGYRDEKWFSVGIYTIFDGRAVEMEAACCRSSREASHHGRKMRPCRIIMLQATV
jgi:hypothetical protein